MIHGINEFPIRLDETALREIAGKSTDNEVYVRVNMILPRVSSQEHISLRNTLSTLIALQDYMKSRRVDPGFQVVTGE